MLRRDEHGNVLEANNYSDRVLQVRTGKLRGMSFFHDLVVPEHEKEGRTIVAKALAGEPVEGVGIALRVAGDRINVMFNAQRTKGGRVVCVGQDTTARIHRDQDFERLISTASARMLLRSSTPLMRTDDDVFSAFAANA